MEIEKILGVEELTYQGEDGEQKVHMLSDAEAVEQLLNKLQETGISDTIQVSSSTQFRAGKEAENHDASPQDIGARLRASTVNSPDNSLMAVDEIGQLLAEKYLAIDGEQKVYLLPDSIDVEQILESLPGLQTGEIKQSQMWRKTEVKIDTKERSKIMVEMNNRFQAVDERLKRLESLFGKSLGLELDK